MWQFRLRRLLYRQRVSGTALADCWRRPLPSTGGDWRRASYLVCDAEMTSLEVQEGELLSVGWVCIDEGAVQLSSARHHLIRPSVSVGQSATIHQLRDCELEDAEGDAAVLDYFLKAAAGRILVFHHAVLDLAYLNRLSRRCYNAPLLMQVVDTLALEQRRLNRRDTPIKGGDLRLQACRDRYGLPAYPAHNALLDALATAELLLAQASHGAHVFPG